MPLVDNPNVLVPNNKKGCCYDDTSESALPGGLVKLDERVLHCTVTSLATVDVGKFLYIF